MEINERLKDAVNKLKAVFAEETKKEEFMLKVKTSEGVEVTLDKSEVVVGAKATIVSPEGSEVPAPEGDHVLEDGTVITVAGGEVVAVVPKAEVEVEDKKDDKEVIEKMSAEIEAGKTANAELLARINKLEELINSKFSEQVKMEEKVSAMFEAVQAIANIPAEEPVEVEHKFSKKETKNNKAAALADLISKYK